MVFLPGDHVLDTNITVANVTRLTMCGESSSDNIATIVRNESVGFSFTNMVNFNTYSLAFTSYNRSWSYGSHPASNSVLLLQSTPSAKLVNCSFHDNLGTALVANKTIITLEENNSFIQNQCTCQSFSEMCGCGITAFNSSLTFTGNTIFLENNGGFSGAGAIWASGSSLHFTGTNNFTGNSGYIGGAIYASDNVVLTFSGTNYFFNNAAKLYGGAFHAETNTSLSFTGTNHFSHNSGDLDGGAVDTVDNVLLTFSGTNNFFNNSANGYGRSAMSGNGAAIFTANNVVFAFSGISNFINNSANNRDGGAIFALVNISLSFTGTSSFINNSATHGGAISANRNSTLTFDGNVSFSYNTADSRGGAIYLYSSSTILIKSNTTVCLESNHATLGGTIYVLNINPLVYCTQIAMFIPREECFFQLPGQNLSSGLDVHLVFKNNSADAAGSVLYGGAIDNCRLTGLDSGIYNSSQVFDMLVQYQTDNTTSSITSEPFRICPCENNHPNCSKSNKTLSVHPGETIQVSVVSVGQRGGVVPAQVISNLDRGRLLSSQYIQQTTKMCTTLNYTVFLQQSVSQLELYADSPCSFSDEFVLLLNINQTCPRGFYIDQEEESCICDPVLQEYANYCNITNGLGQITRESDNTFWFGYDQSQGVVIVHPHCPFDYCVNHNTVVFPLNNTDIQCDHHRSGFLCGRCKQGYSLLLGFSQCKLCTNTHLAWLVLFAVMGVALVFLLLVCKLTVAAGTLSGLVFYANIVGVNRTLFLPAGSTDALSVFIAWLNLDFGIETCFYNGLDAYGKTWLQFVFPVYIWVLVGLMIFISHFSQKFANLLGSNPVSVLATLILLSYTKVLRTLIAAISFTDLVNPSYPYNRKVWLYDANIDYLEGKHIPLFLVAMLVFLFLFLPYTLLLLFGQWLQAISHLRLFSWVNRLKPFMDSYHAPYKAKHRYWPGLLLVLRFVLLLVFASNPQQDPSVNLITILVGAGILQMWAWVSGGVYRNWCLNALEGSFVLNLLVLVFATYHVKLSGGDQRAVGYTSISIALVSFIGVLSYHIFQQLRHTKLWKKAPKLNLEFKKLHTKQAEENLNKLTNDTIEFVKFNQLREPLLDDPPQPTHSVV